MKQYSALFFVSFLSITIEATCQGDQPILRMETGMHMASARTIATDASGKYLLSCSDDKTARLWDAATGQLLNTLRIPIGKDSDGELYACALTRDGRIAAVGGWTPHEGDNQFSIYLLDTQTGHLVRRIREIDGSIWDIEFSIDGKWLAAGLGLNAGVKIFETKNWSLYKEFGRYDGGVPEVAFDKNNRLATVSDDGKIRLYDSDFTLLKEDTLSDNVPISLCFNPVTDIIAVGYWDVARVELRDGNNLSLVSEPSKEGLSKESVITSLAFSPDGRYLYGGGSSVKPDKSGHSKYIIRKWDNAGKGSYTDYLLMEKSVTGINCLPNGKIAIIGSFPDIAVIEPGGRANWYHRAGNNDYRVKDKSHFKINETASYIGFTPLMHQPVSVDIPSRLVLQQTSMNSPPTDSINGAFVSEQGFDASINNIKIDFLEGGDRILCVDINGNGSAIILGGDLNLYKTDKEAVEIWKIPLPASAAAVNISGNEKVVVAALADGTIRWYNMVYGEELLAFYLHADQKRWVLFTPSGYYDASPGAENLLGWHLNHGADGTPSFYPVSRFKEQFYRPDIIDAILESYHEKGGIALADSRSSKKTIVVHGNLKEEVPPLVIITRPANGSTFSNDALVVNYSLETPEDAPVKNIKVLVNGRPVAVERGVKILPSNNYTISVNIPQNDCTVTLLAENDNGISPEANLYLKYKAPEKRRDEFVKKPKLYVLAIGISEYVNADYKLNFADDDAKSIVAALRQLKGGLYEDAIVKALIDKDATRENMQDGLQWIQDQTTQHDVAMIFYAGHGINDNNGIFYMLPVNADVKRIRSTCLNFEELKQTVSNIAGKVVVFIDACHSGNVMGTGRRNIPDINAIVNELSSTENGSVTFTSSTGKEYSLENKEWQHGAFTKALLEGFSGKAVVPGTKKITVKSLDAFVSERVKVLTNGKQHPTSVVPPNVPDFPIAVIQ